MTENQNPPEMPKQPEEPVAVAHRMACPECDNNSHIMVGIGDTALVLECLDCGGYTIITPELLKFMIENKVYPDEAQS